MRVLFRYKIMFAFIFVEALFLSIIIGFNYNATQKFTDTIIEDDIKKEALLFQELIITPVMMYDLATLDNLVAKFGDSGNISQVVVKDTKQRVLSKFINKDYYAPIDENHIHKTYLLNFDGLVLGEVFIVFDIKDINDKVKQNTEDIVKIAALEILLSLILSFFLGKELSKYLTKLDQSVRKISIDKNKYVEVDIDSNDEFKDLADSFNHMQQRLQEEIEKNREKDKEMLMQKVVLESRSDTLGGMLGQIIHQWKQPLSIISASNSSADVYKMLGEKVPDDILEQSSKDIKEQVEKMTSTFDEFRNYFAPEERSDFDVNLSVERVLNLVQKVYSRKDVLIQFKESKNLKVHGCLNEIAHAIMNIMNRSYKQIVNSDGIYKTIHIETLETNGKAVINISDYASNVSEKDLQDIFKSDSTNEDNFSLEVARIIIKKFNGSIEVNKINDLIPDVSRHLDGIRFTITLDLV